MSTTYDFVWLQCFTTLYWFLQVQMRKLYTVIYQCGVFCNELEEFLQNDQSGISSPKRCFYSDTIAFQNIHWNCRE